MHNCTEQGEVREIQREFSMPHEVLKRSLASIFFSHLSNHTSPPSFPPTAPACISLLFITCAFLKHTGISHGVDGKKNLMQLFNFNTNTEKRLRQLPCCAESVSGQTFQQQLSICTTVRGSCEHLKKILRQMIELYCTF